MPWCTLPASLTRCHIDRRGLWRWRIRCSLIWSRFHVGRRRCGTSWWWPPRNKWLSWYIFRYSLLQCSGFSYSHSLIQHWNTPLSNPATKLVTTNTALNSVPWMLARDCKKTVFLKARAFELYSIRTAVRAEPTSPIIGIITGFKMSHIEAKYINIWLRYDPKC